MRRRQFSLLLVLNLITWWTGMGLMPLLPIYAAHLGAPPALIGNYLSISFLALSVGTMVAGWLSGRLQRRRDLIIVISLIAAPAIGLMGQVTHFWQLILLTAVAWFAGGAVIVLINVLAGLEASAGERGKRFGLLSFASALAGVLGGTTGLIVDRWGYPLLLGLVAVTWIGQVIVALALREPNVSAETPQRSSVPAGMPFAQTFWLLLLAHLLVSTGSSVANMGRSLAMDVEGFSATAVTLTAAIGSCAGLVVGPFVGSLSDRIDRQLVLMGIYAVGGVALAVMASTASLLGFWIAAILMAMAATERVVSSALVTDLLSPASLDRGMSLFDTVRWIGGVIGFAGMGYAMQFFGLHAAIIGSIVLPLLALLILLMMRRDAVTTPAHSSLPSR